MVTSESIPSNSIRNLRWSCAIRLYDYQGIWKTEIQSMGNVPSNRLEYRAFLRSGPDRPGTMMDSLIPSTIPTFLMCRSWQAENVSRPCGRSPEGLRRSAGKKCVINWLLSMNCEVSPPTYCLRSWSYFVRSTVCIEMQWDGWSCWSMYMKGWATTSVCSSARFNFSLLQICSSSPIFCSILAF